MLREFPKRIKGDAEWQAAMLAEAPPPAPGHGPGLVRLTVIVGNDGNVLEAQPLDGPEHLFALAVETVKQWKFRSTTLNGRPVEVQSTVELFVP